MQPAQYHLWQNLLLNRKNKHLCSSYSCFCWWCFFPSSTDFFGKNIKDFFSWGGGWVITSIIQVVVFFNNIVLFYYFSSFWLTAKRCFWVYWFYRFFSVTECRFYWLIVCGECMACEFSFLFINSNEHPLISYQSQYSKILS